MGRQTECGDTGSDMRLLIKLAFLIGLALFFLAPRPGDENGVPAGLSAGSLMFAAQEVVTDIGGFCDRSPVACESGRDALHFAGARIVEGMTFVYGLATSRDAPAAGPAVAAPVEAAPMDTAPAAEIHQARAPNAPPLPRPYVAPAG